MRVGASASCLSPTVKAVFRRWLKQGDANRRRRRRRQGQTAAGGSNSSNSISSGSSSSSSNSSSAGVEVGAGAVEKEAKDEEDEEDELDEEDEEALFRRLEAAYEEQSALVYRGYSDDPRNTVGR